MLVQEKNSNIDFFGIALDPTDDPLKMKFKFSFAQNCAFEKSKFKSPYSGIRSYLKDLFEVGAIKEKGEIKVPGWLMPAPSVRDLGLVTPVNNVAFIDANGCLKYAERVKEFVNVSNGGNIPAMIAVDHSMTGGMLEALVPRYSSENITVLILDSHFDAFSFSERVEVLKYAGRKYPDSTNYADLPPFSNVTDIDIDIPEIYNCGTFLKWLLKKELISPERLIVLGVSDYPTEEMKKDLSTKKYVKQYLQYEQEGAIFITKQQIDRMGIEKLMVLLQREIKTNYVYISLDADVGALNAIYAARFLNCVGLSKRQIYEIADGLGKALQKQFTLIGLDICEIEIFLAGIHLPNNIVDHSLEVLSDFVRLLLAYPPRFV